MISYLTSFIFGLSVFVGVVVFSFLLWKKGKKKDLDVEMLFDWSLLMIVSFLFFGRLFYIFENFSLYSTDIFRWIHLVRYPGISGSGGVLGIFITSYFFFRLRKANAWPYLDALVLPFLYGYFLVQIGCLANGCVEGKMDTLPSFLPMFKVRNFTHPVVIYSLALSAFQISFFKKAGSFDLGKKVKKIFNSEKIPFKIDGIFFLCFFLVFSLVNLTLAIFAVNTIYFKNINSKSVYFSVTALLSLVLIIHKIGPKNLFILAKGIAGRKVEQKT